MYRSAVSIHYNQSVWLHAVNKQGFPAAFEIHASCSAVHQLQKMSGEGEKANEGEKSERREEKGTTNVQQLATPSKQRGLIPRDFTSVIWPVLRCHQFLLQVSVLLNLAMIHYVNKSMRIPARRKSHSKIMGINMKLVPPLCCYNSLHS